MSQIQITKDLGLEIATEQIVLRLKPLEKWQENMEHETRIIVRGPRVTGQAIIASPTPKQLGERMIIESIDNAILKLQDLKKEMTSEKKNN